MRRPDARPSTQPDRLKFCTGCLKTGAVGRHRLLVRGDDRPEGVDAILNRIRLARENCRVFVPLALPQYALRFAHCIRSLFGI
ncbi:hypothetical protein ACVWZ6_001434 [Bradyrhizobium sp. GM6.1]